MDEEALSWFVDDIVAKTVLGVTGVGRFERLPGRCQGRGSGWCGHQFVPEAASHCGQSACETQ